ncbi:unnamed protein product [Dracunculus medinensis]|uniref:7TM_GPCR_Srx domain-containing protein n=1 Tax=Dracunculus medinensis TaxID=318479 RepID=A0A0N4UAU6_DRAME|nr:unnamed protein product [Dracunculus medinensis]
MGLCNSTFIIHLLISINRYFSISFPTSYSSIFTKRFSYSSIIVIVLCTLAIRTTNFIGDFIAEFIVEFHSLAFLFLRSSNATAVSIALLGLSIFNYIMNKFGPGWINSGLSSAIWISFHTLDGSVYSLIPEIKQFSEKPSFVSKFQGCFFDIQCQKRQ